MERFCSLIFFTDFRPFGLISTNCICGVGWLGRVEKSEPGWLLGREGLYELVSCTRLYLHRLKKDPQPLLVVDVDVDPSVVVAVVVVATAGHPAPEPAPESADADVGAEAEDDDQCDLPPIGGGSRERHRCDDQCEHGVD